jgi:hypothetical protein
MSALAPIRFPRPATRRRDVPNKHINLTNHSPKRRLRTKRILSVVCRLRAYRYAYRSEGMR